MIILICFLIKQSSLIVGYVPACRSICVSTRASLIFGFRVVFVGRQLCCLVISTKHFILFYVEVVACCSHLPLDRRHHMSYFVAHVIAIGPKFVFRPRSRKILLDMIFGHSLGPALSLARIASFPNIAGEDRRYQHAVEDADIFYAAS